MANWLISGLYDTKLLRNNSGTIAAVDVPKGNEITFNVDTEDLVWNGDGVRKTVTSVAGFQIEISADAFNRDVLNTMFSVTPVTTSLPTGVTNRSYYGTDATDAGVVAGFTGYCTMIDVSSGATSFGRITAPRGTLQPPAPPDLASKSIASQVLNFSADKTTTDVAGAALPSVPTNGCTWYFEELSAATASY